MYKERLLWEMVEEKNTYYRNIFVLQKKVQHKQYSFFQLAWILFLVYFNVGDNWV